MTSTTITAAWAHMQTAGMAAASAVAALIGPEPDRDQRSAALLQVDAAETALRAAADKLREARTTLAESLQLNPAARP